MFWWRISIRREISLSTAVERPSSSEQSLMTFIAKTFSRRSRTKKTVPKAPLPMVLMGVNCSGESAANAAESPGKGEREFLFIFFLFSGQSLKKERPPN